MKIVLDSIAKIIGYLVICTSICVGIAVLLDKITKKQDTFSDYITDDIFDM